MRRILVSDIMTREPITAKPGITLLDCARKLVKERTGSLLIVEKERLIGIISRHDILWALVKKSPSDLEKIKAIDISPRKIATIKPNSTIEEAIKKIKETKFERLPVIKDKKLVGIITVKDILNFNPEFYPELDEFAEIKEETRKLKLVEKAKERDSLTEGVCDECGEYGFLYPSKGMMICEDCKNY